MAVIRDPAEKRLRALMMLEMRLKQAASLEEIAKAFNVAPKTVQKNLTWARKAGLIADAEDKILQELVPAAHEALLKALRDPTNRDAGKLAIDVFKGTISGFKKEPARTVTATGGDDLDTYLDRLRADNPNILDGETVEGGAQRALPPAPASSTEEGVVSPDFVAAPMVDDAPECAPAVGERVSEGTPADAAGE
jgi:transposase-like protein